MTLLSFGLKTFNFLAFAATVYIAISDISDGIAFPIAEESEIKKSNSISLISTLAVNFNVLCFLSLSSTKKDIIDT